MEIGSSQKRSDTGRWWGRAALGGAVSAGMLTGGLLIGSSLLGGATPLLAQNQSSAEPAEGAEEQVEVVLPDTGIIRRQLGLIAPQGTPNRAEPGLDQFNPFAGKVLLIATYDAVHPPYEEVRIESVAGREFLVIRPEGPARGGHQMWVPIGEVQSMHVFDSMQAANQFWQSRAPER